MNCLNNTSLSISTYEMWLVSCCPYWKILTCHPGFAFSLCNLRHCRRLLYMIGCRNAGKSSSPRTVFPVLPWCLCGWAGCPRWQGKVLFLVSLVTWIPGEFYLLCPRSWLLREEDVSYNTADPILTFLSLVLFSQRWLTTLASAYSPWRERNQYSHGISG